MLSLRSLRAFRRKYRWENVPKHRRVQAYVGLVGAGTALTLQAKFKECVEVVGNPAQVTSPNTLFWLRVLFGRTRSRFMGSLAEAHVPVALRPVLYKAFAWKFDVDLDEVRYPLDSYRVFQDFFARELKEGCRPIAEVKDGLVSPVDGRVVKSGVITEENQRIEQVKGATYAVRSFLGLDPTRFNKEDTTVHYVVLYLAPGNYHRVHSPCDVRITSGRHFCGELMPLREALLKRVDDIYSVNERVVLSGKWKFGNMHITAVAAANVGNIFLDFDEKLKTNKLRDIAVHCGGDISSKIYPDGVELTAGGRVGGFKMGSTVVLTFDAPRDFQWKVAEGDLVKVGQPLGQAAAP